MSGVVVQLASQVFFHASNCTHQHFPEVAESKIFPLHSAPKHALLQVASASSAADSPGDVFSTRLAYFDFVGSCLWLMELFL